MLKKYMSHDEGKLNKERKNVTGKDSYLVGHQF